MIEAQKLTDGYLLFLPLCPSTNRRTSPVVMGRFAREILTKEARDYIANVSRALWLWAKTVKIAPVQNYRKIDIWFILPRTTCDAHNYGKVLFDAIELSGLVTNDKYILPNIRGVWHDSKAAAAIVKL